MLRTIGWSTVALAVFVHSLWGVNPVAVKFSLLAVPPLWTAFARFTLGIVFIAIYARIAGIALTPTRDEWPVLGFIAALFTVQIAAMNIGFDNTTGTMGAILISTNPLFAAAAAHVLVAGDRLNAVRALGLAGAFLGVVAVLLSSGSAGAGAVFGNMVVLASAAILGFRLALSARALRRIEPVRVAIWQMILSLPLFAAGGLAFETVAWDRLGWMPILGIAYQGLVIAGFCFVMAFWLMKHHRPSVIMSFSFVSPIAGVLVSAWLLGESVGPAVLLGMTVVAGGLYLITASVD